MTPSIVGVVDLPAVRSSIAHEARAVGDQAPHTDQEVLVAGQARGLEGEVGSKQVAVRPALGIAQSRDNASR